MYGKYICHFNIAEEFVGETYIYSTSAVYSSLLKQNNLTIVIKIK
jgi:hypothetical protein